MRIMKFSVNYTADLTRIEIRIIFEPITIAIFRLCLLPKMRLSVDLEGRCTAYHFVSIFSWNETSMHVSANQVRLIIGRGGDTIRKMEKDSGAKITVEKNNNAAQRDHP